MAGKISELKNALSVQLTDLFETTVIENGEYKTRKQTLSAIANAILNAFSFSSLKTTSKTIISAINEAYENGGGTEIDDDNVSTETTWSSYQIRNYVKKNADSIVTVISSGSRNTSIPISVTVQDAEE